MDELIEKYWNSETSLAEEAKLKAYFAQENLPAEHLQYKALFDFYEKEANRSMPTKRKRSLRPFFLAIAASLAILISMGVFYTTQQEEREQIALTTDTFEDPEEAYQEAKKALLMISAQLNSGKKYHQEFRPIRRVSELLYPAKKENQ